VVRIWRLPPLSGLNDGQDGRAAVAWATGCMSAQGGRSIAPTGRGFATAVVSRSHFAALRLVLQTIGQQPKQCEV